MSILLVEFLKGSRKVTFDLEVSSYNSIESGGIPHQNTYNLVLDDEFLDFRNYLVNEFGENRNILPNQASIIQKNRGIDSNLPWFNRLELSDGNTTESIEFYPFICEIQNNDK